MLLPAVIDWMLVLLEGGAVGDLRIATRCLHRDVAGDVDGLVGNPWCRR